MNYGPNIIRAIDSRFSQFHLRIRRSRIHRVGVFAAEPISPRRKVLEYTGERLNVRRFKIRYQEVWGPGGPKKLYLFRLNRHCYVDGAVGGCGAEFINHSCDPNLRVQRTRHHILFFSRRHIRAGEELTFDYRLHPKAIRIRCRCGSPNCRGTLNRKSLRS